MKKTLRNTLGLVAIAVTSLALAADVKCALDNNSMYFTGKTKTEMGKLLQEHKCPLGHVVWVVS